MAQKGIRYRTYSDFQKASAGIFELLHVDLNGSNARRARAARETYEFLTMLLAQAQQQEDRAANAARELALAKGVVQYLEKKVSVIRAPGNDVDGGEDQ